MNPAGLIFVLIGVFSLCGAIFDWDWFMNSRRARLFVMLFTRTGARIFYALLGGAFVIGGILFALGILRNSV